MSTILMEKLSKKVIYSEIQLEAAYLQDADPTLDSLDSNIIEQQTKVVKDSINQKTAIYLWMKKAN